MFPIISFKKWVVGGTHQPFFIIFLSISHSKHHPICYLIPLNFPSYDMKLLWNSAIKRNDQLYTGIEFGLVKYIYMAPLANVKSVRFFLKIRSSYLIIFS
jgi:hypothetical protein